MGKSRLEGKVALITGGARGMGASEAQLFIDEGARVVISDVLDSVGQETAKRLSPNGSKCVFLHHDVTSEDDWNAVVASVLETFGQIDILVNNAESLNVVQYLIQRFPHLLAQWTSMSPAYSSE